LFPKIGIPKKVVGEESRSTEGRENLEKEKLERHEGTSGGPKRHGIGGKGVGGEKKS